VLESAELKARHVYAVLSLEPAEQVQLLSMAVSGAMAGREARSEASSHRSSGGRGRPRHTPLRRAAKLLGRFLELDVPKGAPLVGDLRRRDDTLELLRRVRAKCDELERLITSSHIGVELPMSSSKNEKPGRCSGRRQSAVALPAARRPALVGSRGSCLRDQRGDRACVPVPASRGQDTRRQLRPRGDTG